MQRKTPQTSDIDDETLFAKVERGDVEAFTAVYNKYHKLLLCIGLSLFDEFCDGRRSCAARIYPFLGIPFGASGRHQPEKLPDNND